MGLVVAAQRQREGPGGAATAPQDQVVLRRESTLSGALRDLPPVAGLAQRALESREQLGPCALGDEIQVTGVRPGESLVRVLRGQRQRVPRGQLVQKVDACQGFVGGHGGALCEWWWDVWWTSGGSIS